MARCARSTSEKNTRYSPRKGMGGEGLLSGSPTLSQTVFSRGQLPPRSAKRVRRRGSEQVNRDPLVAGSGETDIQKESTGNVRPRRKTGKGRGGAQSKGRCRR